MHETRTLNSVPNLSTKAYNILRFDLHCKTIGDVLRLPKKDILRVIGVGPVTIRELNEVFGLEL